MTQNKYCSGEPNTDWAIFNKTTVDNIKSSNGKQLRSESGRGGEAVALIGLKKKSLLIIV
jgi:uncharacterized membrane protein